MAPLSAGLLASHVARSPWSTSKLKRRSELLRSCKASQLASTSLPNTAVPRRTEMGIKGLSKLLGDNAARCVKEHDLKSYFGRKIAIDASMSIYQFLVAVRIGADNLTNDAGEITSHLNGLFYRTIRLLEVGIKPAYVFDGKPPPMKAGELAKRAAQKKENEAAAAKAEEEGDVEAAEKYGRRVNKVTPEMTEGCKRLLTLMGVPVVNAPCEAEAQCAELCKEDVVYATATEDMDALTFGSKKVLRQLWAGATAAAEKKGTRPREFNLETALEELELSMAQFVDLCILCGCDYADGIRGIGPTKALNLIRKEGDLETIVSKLRENPKHTVPEEYPVDRLREMFYKPEVTPASEVKLLWKAPDEEGVIKFMCDENQFDVDKIRSGLNRIEKSKHVGSQTRLDSFFKVVTVPKDKANGRKQPGEKGARGASRKRAAGAAVDRSKKRSRG